MRVNHHSISKMAKEFRKTLKDTYNLSEGEDVFALAQVFSFMVHSTSIEKLTVAAISQRNRFAIRKMKAVLDLLYKVFDLEQ